ncbi:hypothetical protein AB7M39_005546 [Bradyrhizobium diazoefficiens]
MFDPLTPRNPPKIVLALLAAIRRKQDRRRLSDRFLGRIAVEAFGCRVPADDDAVERLQDDRIVGGLDRRAEQAFADGELVADGLGATPLLDLVLQCRRLCLHLLDHVGKGPRQHARLAACIDGNVRWPSAADGLHGRGQAPDRASQGARQQHRERSRGEDGKQADEQGRFLNGGRHAAKDGRGNGHDDCDPFLARKQRRRDRRAARPARSIGRELRGYSRRACQG